MRVISSNNNLHANRTRLEELEARLHQGDAMIRKLEAENKPVESLERHWLQLLREYQEEFWSTQSAA